MAADSGQAIRSSQHIPSCIQRNVRDDEFGTTGRFEFDTLQTPAFSREREHPPESASVGELASEEVREAIGSPTSVSAHKVTSQFQTEPAHERTCKRPSKPARKLSCRSGHEVTRKPASGMVRELTPESSREEMSAQQLEVGRSSRAVRVPTAVVGQSLAKDIDGPASSSTLVSTTAPPSYPRLDSHEHMPPMLVAGHYEDALDTNGPRKVEERRPAWPALDDPCLSAEGTVPTIPRRLAKAIGHLERGDAPMDWLLKELSVVHAHLLSDAAAPPRKHV